MITILLWGDRWWLPRQKMPVPFAGMDQAAAMLAAAWPEKTRRLRVIYQPEDFATVPAVCPNTNRATLKLALAEEHPVVRHPGLVWGYEPILPAGESFSTLLHHETRPALFALVQQLEEEGFGVDSVWPLPTWLNALPPDLTDSGAITIFALHPDRFCIYRHSAAGARTVHTGHGSDALETLVALLRPMVAENPAEFILCVTTNEALLVTLEERLALEGGQVVGIFTLQEALAKPAPLPPQHPAQLLPPVPRFTASRVVAVTTLMLALGALVGGAGYARTWSQARTHEAERVVAQRQLQGEVEHLRANHAEISALRAEIAALSRPSPRIAEFLRKVAATVPPEVVVTTLQVTAGAFTVNGWAKPGAAEPWARQLGSDVHCALQPDGAFNLRSLSP
jgi:cell division protein FtsB